MVENAEVMAWYSRWDSEDNCKHTASTVTLDHTRPRNRQFATYINESVAIRSLPEKCPYGSSAASSSSSSLLPRVCSVLGQSSYTPSRRAEKQCDLRTGRADAEHAEPHVNRNTCCWCTLPRSHRQALSNSIQGLHGHLSTGDTSTTDTTSISFYFI